MTDIKLAKIIKASLAIKEREILNFQIHVTYENGFSQVIGHIALDKYDPATDERVGTAYGCDIIRRLLIELQVDDFSEMTGKHIWVYGEDEKHGFDFKVKGIKALKVDNCKARGVFWAEIAEEYKEEINGA